MKYRGGVESGAKRDRAGVALDAAGSRARAEANDA
jgi:hypothetical protein